MSWTALLKPFKTLFKSKSSVAIGSAVATAAVTAPIAAAIGHKVAKDAYRAIKADPALLQKVNKSFRDILEQLPENNRVAQIICHSVLDDPFLMFCEVGRIKRNGDFRNPNTEADFKNMMAKFLNSTQGWVTPDVLAGIQTLIDQVFSSGIAYLIHKKYLVNDSANSSDTFGLCVSRDKQKDLGSSTMIVFLNIFSKMFERFLAIIDSEGELSTLKMEPKTVIDSFHRLIQAFIDRSESILQKGESSFLDWVRAGLNIDSKRVAALKKMKLAFEKHYGKVVSPMNTHRKGQQIKSLAQELATASFMSSRYFVLSFEGLVQCDMLAKSKGKKRINNKLTLLNKEELLRNNTEKFKPLFLSGSDRVDQPHLLEKKGSKYHVEPDSAKDFTNVLFFLSILQSLAGSLSELIQDMLPDTGGTKVSNLAIYLLKQIHCAIAKTLSSLFTMHYYSAWKEQLIDSKKAARIMSISDGSSEVYLRNVYGDPTSVIVGDDDLLPLISEINELPEIWQKKVLRQFVASQQQQRFLLNRYVELLGQDLEKGREVRPLNLKHLEGDQTSILEVCVFFLNKENFKRVNAPPLLSKILKGIIKSDANSPFLLKTLIKKGAKMKEKFKALLKGVNTVLNKKLQDVCDSQGLSPNNMEDLVKKIMQACEPNAAYFFLLPPKRPGKKSYLYLCGHEDAIRSEENYKAALACLAPWVSSMSEFSTALDVSVRNESGKRVRNLFRVKKETKIITPFVGISMEENGKIIDSVSPSSDSLDSDQGSESSVSSSDVSLSPRKKEERTTSPVKRKSPRKSSSPIKPSASKGKSSLGSPKKKALNKGKKFTTPSTAKERIALTVETQQANEGTATPVDIPSPNKNPTADLPLRDEQGSSSLLSREGSLKELSDTIDNMAELVKQFREIDESSKRFEQKEKVDETSSELETLDVDNSSQAESDGFSDEVEFQETGFSKSESESDCEPSAEENSPSPQNAATPSPRPSASAADTQINETYVNVSDNCRYFGGEDVKLIEKWGSFYKKNSTGKDKSDRIKHGFKRLEASFNAGRSYDKVDTCYYRNPNEQDKEKCKLKDEYSRPGVLARLFDLVSSHRYRTVTRWTSDRLPATSSCKEFIAVLKKFPDEFKLIVDDLEEVYSDATDKFAEYASPDENGGAQAAPAGYNQNSSARARKAREKISNLLTSFQTTYEDFNFNLSIEEVDDSKIRKLLHFWVLFRYANELLAKDDVVTKNDVIFYKMMQTFSAANSVLPRNHFEETDEAKHFLKGGRKSYVFT